MAGRGPQSFKKRQKEQQRKEKQMEKNLWEKDGITPRSLWLEAGKTGFLGLTVGEQNGGGATYD